MMPINRYLLFVTVVMVLAGHRMVLLQLVMLIQCLAGESAHYQTEQQAEAMDQDPNAVKQADGSYLYMKADGTFETALQRERRLAHNTKMCFHRTFDSSTLPPTIRPACTYTIV